MPRINLPVKRIRKRKKYSEKKNNDNHKWVYNTSTWRSLRLNYLMNNPLCEDCLIENPDKLSSAMEVHHIIPLSTDDTFEGKRKLGFDYKNLRSLCKEHHKKVHMGK